MRDNDRDEIDLTPEVIPDIVLFDESDPDSLINRVWPELATTLRTWPQSKMFLWNRTEKEMRRSAKVDNTLNLVRIRFWEEVHNAYKKNKKVKQRDITDGLVFREYWPQTIGSNLNKLAYVLTPPLRYRVRLEGLLDLALGEMGDILSMETDDSRILSLKVKICEFLHPLVRGAVTQKVQIDQRVLTQSLSASDVASIDGQLESMQKQLKGSEVVAIDMPKLAEVDVSRLSRGEPK